MSGFFLFTGAYATCLLVAIYPDTLLQNKLILLLLVIYGAFIILVVLTTPGF